ncbi:MAG: hypothetical protein R2713_20840 [Ilumatobacteraceae bacterium]
MARTDAGADPAIAWSWQRTAAPRRSATSTRAPKVFDYGNGHCCGPSWADSAPFDYLGFLPGLHPPLFCEGKGPSSTGWRALSELIGGHRRHHCAVLEEFPDDEHPRTWIGMAGAGGVRDCRCICWLDYGERHRLGLRFNDMVRRGELGADRDRGSDHRLGLGGVAGPRRPGRCRTDGGTMPTGPLLNTR